MVWNAYATGPIDAHWEFLHTVPTVAAMIAGDEAAAAASGSVPWGNLRSQQFLEAISEARDAASKLGWEGDFREEPRVFWLPDADTGELVFGFVWKQDNNGSTFVVSPLPLPWLDGR